MRVNRRPVLLTSTWWSATSACGIPDDASNAGLFPSVVLMILHAPVHQNGRSHMHRTENSCLRWPRTMTGRQKKNLPACRRCRRTPVRDRPRNGEREFPDPGMDPARKTTASAPTCRKRPLVSQGLLLLLGCIIRHDFFSLFSDNHHCDDIQ